MYPLVLRGNVRFKGTGFYGLPAELSFEPCDEPGIYWQPHDTRYMISPDIAHLRRTHSLLLRAGRITSLEVLEHILPIIAFGFDHLVISCSRRIPPYIPAGFLWDVVKGFCDRDMSRLIECKTVSETVRWDYPDPRGGVKAYTQIAPAENGLTLEVHCSYKEFGQKTKLFSVNNIYDLKKICSARALSIHPKLYWPSRFSQTLGIWPHHRTVLWPQDSTSDDVLDEIINHRAQDILGSFGLLCGDGRHLAGHITSVCSGHEADLEVVRRAYPILT